MNCGIESIPLAGHHGDTQTNTPLDRDSWGLSELLSRWTSDMILIMKSLFCLGSGNPDLLLYRGCGFMLSRRVFP